MFSRRKTVFFAAAALGLAGMAMTSCVTVRDRPIGGIDTRASVTLALDKRNGPPAEYNTAVARVAATLNRQLDGEADNTVTIREQGRSFRVKVATAPEAPWSPPEIEKIRPTEFLRIRGMREHVRQEGVGAPVILELSPEPENHRPFAPPTGRFVPATALVEPTAGGDSGDVTFLLTDPFEPGFSDRSLAADYTAGLATTFGKWHPKPINIPAMILEERYKEQFGLVNIDSIYPDKIPVVFVHGLKSSSGTWKDVINELRRNPAIRERFEFWVFGYGTGAPFPYSAMLLRDSLQKMAEYRTSLGASSNDMVLVGHSMGGILSRIMTTSSGDETWFRFFTKPIDELDVAEDDREFLKNVVYFDSLPFVKRVVFIATPHRGSDFAETPIGRLGSELIRLPVNLLFLSGTILKSGFDVLTPFGKLVAARIPTSIDLLKSDSDLLKLLAGIPLNPDVVHHTILGNRGKDKDDHSTDGIVTYRSAHLDGAVSEKTVPAGHDVHLHPETVTELERILLKHLGR